MTDGLTENVTTESSNSVVDSRFRQGGFATEAEVVGSLETELSVGLFDNFLSAVAMNNWASDVLNFGGNVRKHLPLSKYMKILTKYLFTVVYASMNLQCRLPLLAKSQLHLA